MTILGTVRSLCVVLFIGGLAAAQEPPPLEPPDLEPPKATETTPPKAVKPKPNSSKPTGVSPSTTVRQGATASGSAHPEAGPMLAIPGVTAPSSRPQPIGGSQSAPSARNAIAPFSPVLESSETISGTRSIRLPSDSSEAPARDSLPGHTRSNAIPMTIEPLPDEPVPGQSTNNPANPRSSPRRSANSTAADQPDKDKERPAPKSAPRRAPSLFGRFFTPPPAPSREEPRNANSRGGSRPLSEPETTGELNAKRRIERQIRDTLGDQVRYFEVRITGRNALVVAQPSRFWLRRSVRRSLETLPALEGYRTRIEIKD